MIEPTVLITYIAVAIGFVFLPGPAILLTLTRAASSGARAGIATGAGIAVGDMIHTMMAVIGISALIAASAMLFSAIKYIGAAYLVYLGIGVLLTKSAISLPSAAASISTGAAFRQAVLVETLNPKTALFFLALLPQFVQPENGSAMAQLAILGTLYVALGFGATAVVALCAGALGNVLRRSPKVLKWQSKTVGSIYCALGVRLALQER